jgi:hypothetical protein
MKKLSMIAMGVVLVASLASCKKDYTCACTWTDGSSSLTSSTTIRATKKDAKAACEANQVTNGTSTWKCEIK